MKDLEAEKAARWAKAEKYAQGYADHGMSRALTVYYTRYFPLITLTAFSSAVLIAFLRAGGGPLDWWFIGWSGTYLFALGAVIGGLTYNSKRLKPSVELGSTLSIVMPLENDEQRALTRGINGKQSVPDEHLTIARSLAVLRRKNTATGLLLGPAMTYVLAPRFSSPSPEGSIDWFFLTVLTLLITTLVLSIRFFRRQGHFLTATAPHTTPPG
ncbi:hypothetical protein [Arthrobacter sp. RIT-PI-e]|uniref:hypothetical protein n=1 Tax=Arthrobacter sp. RIT-PI-e TaxID=1681197 RepID=UPI00128F30FB|nr:hypothetical protein [Arthrobacter sp. RIT-PI-e]